MERGIRTLTALAAISCSMPAIADGPFGVNMGDDITKLPSCTLIKNFSYVCKALPKGHPDFDHFILIAVPGFGVCKVGAMGPGISDDPYGTEIRRKADDIAQQIQEKYGDKVRKWDFIRSGALWTDPRDWLMSIKSNERQYAYVWVASDGYVPLERVASIMVKVQARSRTEGYLTAFFEFENFDACSEAIKGKASEAF